MARIRTVPQTVREIKAKDPDSFVNAYLLRRWIKEGVITPIPGTGKHFLIDLDKVEKLLDGEAGA